MVEVQASDGRIYGYTVVAKIALEQITRRKLRYEFVVTGSLKMPVEILLYM